MMESKKKAFSLYDIVMIGLMAAVVFVVTMFLSIRIPTPTGTTMIGYRGHSRRDRHHDGVSRCPAHLPAFV